MKIQFIERIKEFFEKRRLKKLPDEVLEEKIDKNIEGEETGKISLMVGAVDDEKTQIELAKKVVEAADVSMTTKAAILDELPHKTKVKLFKESVKSKELMAQKDVNTFIKIIVNNKSLQPYDELYYRLDKAFSDSQLTGILQTLKEKRPESYDEEKVLRIVAKQIDVDIKKYGTFLPSHVAQGGLFEQIVIRDDNIQDGERTFDILNPKDKQRLVEALKEEREEMKENPKISLTERELMMLSDENLERQIDQVEKFKIKRQEELQQQNKGKEI